MLSKTIEADDAITIRTLNACIETCIDGEKGYAIAAADVRDQTLKALFQFYATQRADFVRALQNAVDRVGGIAENEGTTKGTLHRGLTGARLAIEGRTEAVMLGECERGELAAIYAYDRALEKAPASRLPADVRALVIEQRAAMKSAYDDLTRKDIQRRVAHS